MTSSTTDGEAHQIILQIADWLILRRCMQRGERNTDHLWSESCWRPYLLRRLMGLGLMICKLTLQHPDLTTALAFRIPLIVLQKDCALVDKMQQMGTAGDPQRHGCSLSTPPMWALFHKLWWFITSFVLATILDSAMTSTVFPFCTSWHFSRSQNWDASWTRARTKAGFTLGSKTPMKWTLLLTCNWTWSKNKFERIWFV